MASARMKVNNCCICGEEIRTGSKHCSICSKFYCDIRARFPGIAESQIIVRIKQNRSWLRFKGRRIGTQTSKFKSMESL